MPGAPALRHYLRFRNGATVDELRHALHAVPGTFGLILPAPDEHLRDFALVRELHLASDTDFQIFPATAEWRRSWPLWHHTTPLPQVLQELFRFGDKTLANQFSRAWFLPPPPLVSSEPSHRCRELLDAFRERRRGLAVSSAALGNATRNWATLFALQGALSRDLGQIRLRQLEERRALGGMVDTESLEELSDDFFSEE